MLEVLPLIPITVLPGLSTKYGPDNDPVGLGVTLSYSWPISLPDLQEDLPKIDWYKNPSSKHYEIEKEFCILTLCHSIDNENVDNNFAMKDLVKILHKPHSGCQM